MAPDKASAGALLRDGAAMLADSDTPMLDARILLKLATGWDDAQLILRAEEHPEPEQLTRYENALARRAKGEPIAYIAGEQEFWSLSFKVTPDVLIPRPDSECLIEGVLARRERTTPYSILDLGTGSGCLLCALLYEFGESRGTGVDRSEKALAVARFNAARHNLAGRAHFAAGDWGKGLVGPFDIIVANPPYIAEPDYQGLPLPVRGYEPVSALTAGIDGFDAYRAILADAPRLLASDGLIVFEAGDGQAARLAEMVTETFPAAAIDILNDLKGRPRAVLADLFAAAKKD